MKWTSLAWFCLGTSFLGSILSDANPVEQIVRRAPSYRRTISSSNDDTDMEVICDGFLACFWAEIRCPSRANCHVSCEGGQGNYSCANAQIYPPSDSNAYNAFRLDCHDETSCSRIQVHAHDTNYIFINASQKGAMRGHFFDFENIPEVNIECYGRMSCENHAQYFPQHFYDDVESVNMVCAGVRACWDIRWNFLESNEVDFKMDCSQHIQNQKKCPKCRPAARKGEDNICGGEVIWPDDHGEAMVWCDTKRSIGCSTTFYIPDGHGEDNFTIICNDRNDESCMGSKVRCGPAWQDGCEFTYNYDDYKWECIGSCGDRTPPPAPVDGIPQIPTISPTYKPTPSEDGVATGFETTGTTPLPTAAADGIGTTPVYTTTSKPTPAHDGLATTPSGTTTTPEAYQTTDSNEQTTTQTTDTTEALSTTQNVPGGVGAGAPQGDTTASPVTASPTPKPVTSAPTTRTPTKSPVTPAPTTAADAAAGAGAAGAAGAARGGGGNGSGDSGSDSSGDLLWTILLVVMIICVVLVTVMVVVVIGYVVNTMSNASKVSPDGDGPSLSPVPSEEPIMQDTPWNNGAASSQLI